MAITPGAGTTSFSNAGTRTPSVAVPAGAANGDWLYALLSYAGTLAITEPDGWAVVAGGDLAATGVWQLVRRQMASGVTTAQWTLDASVDGTYAKAATAMFVAKGASGTQAVGAVYVAPSAGATSPLPGVTVPAGGMLLAFAVDRTSSQSSVTAPAGMVERAKYVNGGGGGCSVLIASEMPSAGASGTRTVTYGVSTTNRGGVLVALSPATGTPPVVAAGADAEFAAGTTKTLGGSQTGATSVLWTQTGGPTTSITNPTNAAGASVAPTQAGIYTFRLTGTNSDGTAFDEVVYTVTEPTVEPNGVVVNPGNFTAVVAESLEGAVSDGSDTTWVESGAANASITFALPPVSARTGYAVNARMRWSTTPVRDVLVELLQGGTVISSRTFSPTTSIATYTWSLSGGEVAALTNRTALRLRVSLVG